MPGYGAKGHVGLAKEVTWGTPVAATDYFAIISESLIHEIEQVMEQEIRGVMDEPPQYEGLNSVRGDIVCLARPAGIGFLLRSCLGAPVTTGAAAPYTHTFDTANDFADECALPPYTFEVNRNVNQAWQFAGCVVNELTFELGVTQKLLKVTAGIMGKQVALIAATAPTLEAADPFKWLQAAVLINAVAINDIENLRIKISNNLEFVEAMNGTKYPARIQRNGYRTVDLDLTFGVYNTTEYTRFTGQGETAASITITQDVNNELKFNISKLRYVGMPLGMSGPGRQTVAITAKAKYDATLGGAIEAVLKNSKATY